MILDKDALDNELFKLEDPFTDKLVGLEACLFAFNSLSRFESVELRLLRTPLPELS